MEKFRNKYRIPSARLQNYNYANEGLYFITICTQNKEHYFGRIENGEMILNNLGYTVAEEWLKTPQIRTDMNLESGEFVVMPNHFHAIISIGKNEFNSESGCRDVMHRVSTGDDNYKNKFAPQSKNLASIVRGFKSSVTIFTRKNQIEFNWQARYHDKVIRNYEELARISRYIIYNPHNWKEDEYNS